MTLSYNSRRPIIIGPNLPIYANDTDVWVNTDNNVLYRYDGTTWNVISSASAVSGSGGYTYEQIQDVVSPLLNHAFHTNLTASYDDANNRVVLSVPNESIQDATATLLTHSNHTNITASYNDEFNRVELTNTALDPAVASATYLTQASASSTYLTQASGSSTYLTQANASATYIPQSNQQSIINSASGAAVTYLTNSAPSTLDTLNELATALGSDANFSTTVTNSLAGKLNTSTASATYLTQSGASATYVTQSLLNSLYNNFSRWTKTYSASATTITGLDDNSITLNYNVGLEQVYLNGVLLTKTQDYTTPGSTAIILASAVVSGDIIDVITTTPVNVSNVYNQSDANNIFLTQSSASSTYLRQSSASSAYQTIAGNNNSYRNKLINGDFQVWQRGTSFTEGTMGGTSSSSYCADRWYSYRPTGSQISFSRQLSNLTGFQYCARVQRPNGDNKSPSLVIAQSIESVNCIPFAGNTMTISFWARAGANFSASSNALIANIITGTGTDQSAFNASSFPTNGSYTGASTVLNQTFNITTSWVRYTASMAFASTVTEATIRFYYDPTGTSGINDYFDITGVQLEVGTVATPFEVKPFAQNLEECQRYYGFNPHGSGWSNSTTQASFSVATAVPMRVAPTPTLINGTAGAIDPGVSFRNITSITATEGATIYGANLTVAIGTTSQGKTHNIMGNVIGWSAEI